MAKKPAAEDTVEGIYVGTLIDGTEFDSSYKRGKRLSSTEPRDPRLTEGVQCLLALSTSLLFLQNLAYGERDTGTIPPNHTGFEVGIEISWESVCNASRWTSS